MKKILSLISISTLLLFTVFFSNSCRKNFSIDEINNLNNDSLNLAGSFAGSIIDSRLTLIDFIPDSDSSFWIEVDADELLHIRIFVDNYMTISMNEIFSIPYPAFAPLPVPAESKSFPGDTMNLRINEKMLAGHLYFKEPTITFKFENQIPLTTFFRLDNLYLYDKDTLEIGNASHTPETILAPTVYGATEYTDVLITTAEIPLLSDIFSPIPKFYSYDTKKFCLLHFK